MSETAATPRLHVLVATLNTCEECSAETPCAECVENADLDFTIECPGVEVGRCRLWEECPECKAAGRKPWQEYDYEPLHGVEHDVFDGVLCIETDRCYVQSCDVSDTAWDVTNQKSGRYLVDWDSEDPGDCYLTLAKV